MFAVVLGMENVNYTSKKTGNHVVGTRMYVMDYEPSNSSKFCGRTATMIFTTVNVSHVEVGEVVELVYSQRVDDDRPRLLRVDKVEGALSPLTA